MRDLSVVRQKVIENNAMINAIRIRKNTDATVEMLKDDLGVSRTTADRICSSLIEAGIIERKNRKLCIVGKAGYYLGISIESNYIRLVCLDLNFELVSRETIENEFKIVMPSEYKSKVENDDNRNYRYTYETPNSGKFDDIKAVISSLIKVFLERADADNNSEDSSDIHEFPLLGIGFAVTGPVDYDEKVWYSSALISSIRNINILDLIGYDNQELIDKLNVFVTIDNDTKSAIISEYQYLVEQHNGRYPIKDVALIYFGKGIGSAAIINQTLLRGSHNLSGEVGQIKLFSSDDKSETFEQRLTAEREKGIDCAEQYKKDVPKLLHILNSILGIDSFILVGNMMDGNIPKDAIERIIPVLKAERIKFIVDSTQQYGQLENGRREPSTAAIGAAMGTYFSMCCYEGDFDDDSGDRVNLANVITWKRAIGE